MSNPFYNPTGNPTTGSEGLSALIRGEFIAIATAFDVMPRITTTGLFDTVFNQLGNFTFTLPSAPGTLALSSSVAAETTRATSAEGVLATAIATETTARTSAVAAEVSRATAAEGVNATAIATETTARTAAVSAEVTARNTAIGVETARATAAEGVNATAIGAETTRATAAEAVNAAAALLAAAGIGRNRIHNGGFGINQRVQVSGVPIIAGAYGHDRWKAGAGGCTYTFTQTQPTTVITITAGTLQQVVEAVTVEGGAYTLSWIGTATGRIGGAFLVSPITVAGLPASTAITVEFSTGTLDRVQLEPGSSASTFVRRSYGYELAECQRFYEVCNAFWIGDATSAATYGVAVSFAVEKRASPTLTSLIQAGAANGLMNTRAGSLLPITTRGCSWLATAVSTGPARGFTDTLSASADL